MPLGMLSRIPSTMWVSRFHSSYDFHRRESPGNCLALSLWGRPNKIWMGGGGHDYPAVADPRLLTGRCTTQYATAQPKYILS